MNGFLGQLAALTLHRVETLPPRLPGRFEAGSVAPAEPDPFDQTAETAPSVANPAPAVPEFMPTPANRAAESVGFAGQGTTHLDPPFFRQPQTPAEQPAVQPLPMPVPTASPLSAGRRESPAEPRMPAGADAAAPPVEREITRIEERVTTLTRREQVVSHDASPVGAVIVRTRPPEPESVKPIYPLAAKPEAIIPAVSLRQDSSARQPADVKSEPATAPTIQVTIGRIEIRATQISDKAAAKPRPAQATLSLDDYLKQRDGGRS